MIGRLTGGMAYVVVGMAVQDTVRVDEECVKQGGPSGLVKVHTNIENDNALLA